MTTSGITGQGFLLIRSVRVTDPRAGLWRAHMREVLPEVFHLDDAAPPGSTSTSRPTGSRTTAWRSIRSVPTEDGLEWFAGRPPRPRPSFSNRHHYRDSARFAEAFGCTVRCNSAGLHESTRGEAVEGFEPGDRLPGGIVACEVGGLCPDETALYLPDKRAVLLADGLVRVGSDRQLGFVPDVLMDDPPATKRALLAAYARLLDELDFEHVLLAHGDPLIGDGRARLQEVVDSGGGERRSRWTAEPPPPVASRRDVVVEVEEVPGPRCA